MIALEQQERPDGDGEEQRIAVTAAEQEPRVGIHEEQHEGRSPRRARESVAAPVPEQQRERETAREGRQHGRRPVVVAGETSDLAHGQRVRGEVRDGRLLAVVEGPLLRRVVAVLSDVHVPTGVEHHPSRVPVPEGAQLARRRRSLGTQVVVRHLHRDEQHHRDAEEDEDREPHSVPTSAPRLFARGDG
jgi:hypothetical protein